MTTRADVVREALTWIATPWHHQASTKGLGTDCAGLIVGVARELGLPDAAAFDADPRFKGYGRQPVPRTLLGSCDAYLDSLAPSEAVSGDILLLRWSRSPDPMHFAILVDGDRIVHALQSIGRVVEHGLDAQWRSRVLRAYAYRGLA